MAAPRLKPRVAVTQAEATDAHVGIRLNCVYTNNKDHAETSVRIDSTTASADYDYVAADSGDYDYVAADVAVVNEDGTVEPRPQPEPLPLPSSARPVLRKQPQPNVHTQRWARLLNRSRLYY